jgi:hypothetical protein
VLPGLCPSDIAGGGGKGVEAGEVGVSEGGGALVWARRRLTGAGEGLGGKKYEYRE